MGGEGRGRKGDSEEDGQGSDEEEKSQVYFRLCINTGKKSLKRDKWIKEKA